MAGAHQVPILPSCTPSRDYRTAGTLVACYLRGTVHLEPCLHPQDPKRPSRGALPLASCGGALTQVSRLTCSGFQTPGPRCFLAGSRRSYSRRPGQGTSLLSPSWWVPSGDERSAEWLLTHSAPACLCPVPPSQEPSHAPCPPCGLACFLPRLADLPTALLGRRPARAGFQRHQKPRAGQARPQPRLQLPLVSRRWVGGMGGG